MESLKDIYQDVFNDLLKRVSKGSLEEKICLWLGTNLKEVERLTGKNFYFAKDKIRKQRPFLSCWYEGDTFVVVFLSSTSKGNQKSVNLTLCRKEGCEDFTFYEKVYLFRNRKGEYEKIVLNKFQMETIGKFCGCCENLEKLKKFCLKKEDNNG